MFDAPPAAHDALAEAARTYSVEPDDPYAVELNARWSPPPAPAPTLIVPGLHMGGTPWNRILGRTDAPGDDVGEGHDLVVTLFVHAQPVGSGCEELRFGFPDAALPDADAARVVRIAGYAHRVWCDGGDVLVRCQAGLNRSGLVTALVLIRAGLAPAQAIAHLRATRSRHALCNQHFDDWLTDTRPTPTGDPT